MRRVGRIAIVAAVACVAAVAAPPHAAALGLTWSAEPSPFRLVFHDGGTRTLVEQARPGAPGPGTRLSYELPGGEAHTLTDVVSTQTGTGRATYVVGTSEPGRTARVTVRRTERGLRVETVLVPAAPAVRIYEAFASGDESFLGTGQRAAVNLTGLILQLKVSQPCRNNILAPFYISSRGYGVYVDSAATGALGFRTPISLFESFCAHWGINPCSIVAAPRLTQLCLNAPSLAYEVYAGTSHHIVAAYTALTGRPPLPPPRQLALVKWRDEVRSYDDVVEDVERLQAARIPIGSVILDNPWEAGGCVGALTFGQPLGDPARLLGFLRERRVDLMLWVSPLVRRDCGPQGYPPEALLPQDGRHWALDLRHPEVRQVLERRLRALLAAGVAGFKVDRGDEVDLEGLPAGEHNRYPVRLAEIVGGVLREARGANGTTLVRAGYSGSQKFVPGFWAGDQRQTWRGLLDAVRMAQSASVSGFPIWGSDIGGYANEPDDPPLTAELFLRWAQLGAISPIFEVGGAGANAVFWTFGDETVELFRRSAVLHYELFPYLYELLRDATRTGAPVLRPLGFTYPFDAQAFYRDNQLLVGQHVLAQIVLGPLGTTGAGDRRPTPVWLPAGQWVDMFTGEIQSGRGVVERATSLADFPLYLRRAAAIPFNFRAPVVFADHWDVNDLDRAGRAGWLYAPLRGRRTVARAGKATLAVRWNGAIATLRLGNAPRETAVKLLTPDRVCAVRVDGLATGRVAAAGLPAVASGWAVDVPGRSVVVKRTGGPANATITVRFCP